MLTLNAVCKGLRPTFAAVGILLALTLLVAPRMVSSTASRELANGLPLRPRVLHSRATRGPGCRSTLRQMGERSSLTSSATVHPSNRRGYRDPSDGGDGSQSPASLLT